MLAWLAGPSVASIVLTGLVDGRAGYRDLLARFLRWRVGALWYAVALLLAPLLTLTTALLLVVALRSTNFLRAMLTTHDPLGLLLPGMVAELVAGFCEELGWTGFVIPRLRLPHSIVTTALLLGVVWGVALSVVSGSRQLLGGASPDPPARAAFRLAAGVPGARAVGLRPHRKPARDDAHAREFVGSTIVLRPGPQRA
jgi:membrane protease YdiL (CAAX protease family)